MIKIEGKAFQYSLYFLISIPMNISYKHLKIPDIDFRLMLLEQDRFHMPIND
jgi:hypothetical protein